MRSECDAAAGPRQCVECAFGDAGLYDRLLIWPPIVQRRGGRGWSHIGGVIEALEAAVAAEVVCGRGGH
jgi:hypothetical protein